MNFKSTLSLSCYIIVAIIVTCQCILGRELESPSVLEQKFLSVTPTVDDAWNEDDSLENNSTLSKKNVKELTSKWPFFGSEPSTVPNRKPTPQFGKPLKPKPGNWGGNNDDNKGITTSLGWINMQTGCFHTTAATSYEMTRTTITSTRTEYATTTVTETETDEMETTVTSTVTEMSTHTGWSWETAVTNTLTEYETLVTTTTQTETDMTTIVATSTKYNIITATTYLTSTVTNTIEETTTPEGGWGWGWGGSPPAATIILEPSVLADYTVSTITSTLSETPTLTVYTPIHTTITTSIHIDTETVTIPFSTTPPITITEIIPTWSDMVVDSTTYTVLTSSPQCTKTSYEYLSTVTTPTATFTASHCGNPCGAVDKCQSVCFPKISTVTQDFTSTSIITAPQPIILSYMASETVTAFDIDKVIITATMTSAITGSPMKTTLTTTEVGSLHISTDSTLMTLTSFPATITIAENLCTSTIYETCFTTTTLPPVHVTLMDTQVVGVVGTVTSQTTSFTVPPLPTVTSYVTTNINLVTSTATETVTTNSGDTTTTITLDATTVGYGDTTITPTATVLNIKTEYLTSTPVISATHIKRRTLMAEELVTEVEELVESLVITPTITDYVIYEITPTPSIVTVSTLIVQSSISGGWKRPVGKQ